MLKVGMFIQNRYEIISRIGSGGMADVYKAKDHKLNRFVAVKVMKKEFRDDKVFISKFRVEAQSAAGLAHANIVNIYDVGEEAGIYYIVMELVEGITLKEYIKNKGRLSVREATSIALQISAGLEAAHNNGIIHRDIKPQNIIISTDGRAKVADFGIARASSANTINSNVMGSVHYSSPEQSRGGYSDEKSDIYSLGITMYEMLTGQVPFDGDTAVAVAIKHLQEEVRGPKELVPEIPNSTNEIVLKCTRKSPDRRYPNMTEVIRDLRESLVNPDGNFVTLQTEDNTSRTIVMSKEDINKLNAEQRNMPAYDESLDVGAAAGLHDQESQGGQNRAYQPGSYYHKSGYQEVTPGGRQEPYDGSRWNPDYEEEKEYDPYYDAYDDPEDYAIGGGDYRLEDSFAPKKRLAEDSDGEVGLNPKLEKAVTIGGIIVAVIIGCVFLALVANAFGLFNFGRRTQKAQQSQTERQESESETNIKQVSVPEIRGLSEEDAKKLLESYGLTGTKKGEAEATGYTAGQICSQSPEKGEMVERGSAVEYEVVPAGEGLTLSDMSNIDQNTAQAYLLTQGLQCVIDNTKYSDTVAAGYVISTTPAAGAAVEPGDTVTLYVSQGPETEAEYVTMRDLYYYTPEVAQEAAELMGINAVFEYVASSTDTPGFIISQSVEAGSQVAKGTTVVFKVCSGSDGSAVSSDSGTWTCNASIEEPEGYGGEKVRITLAQSAGETTIYEGAVTFPYVLKVQGAPGETTGTAYVYLLDAAGNVTSKYEYPGINFSQKN